MNMKKLSALIFASVAFAFAQQAAEPAKTAEPVAAPAEAAQPAAETPAVEPAAAPAAEPAKAPAAEPVKVAESAAKPAAPALEAPVRKGPPKTPFTVLHGSAYNTVENEAAADNVDILLNKRITKFYGQKFFYIEPAGERGVFSLGSFFGAMDVSGDLGRATAGYTNGDFGVEGRLSLGQYAIDGDNGKKSGSYVGDDWGLTASKMLAGYVVTASVDWVTTADQTNLEPTVGPTTEERYRDLKGSVIVTNGPSARKHFWSGGVSLTRSEYLKKVGGKTQTDEFDPDENFAIVPVFSYGTPALRNDRANLYLGLNTAIPFVRHKHQKYVDTLSHESVKTHMFNAGVNLTPNILGEVVLKESFMIYGEASYRWNAFRYTSGKASSGDEFTELESLSNVVNATAGFRYQYDNLLACEFAFGDQFFTDSAFARY